jgi:undecaprenyl-diphosphatase
MQGIYTREERKVMNSINFEGFQRINGWAGQSRLLDAAMTAITHSVPYVAIALMIFLWFNGKKDQVLKKRYTALYAFFSSLTALFINAIIHFVYYHPRPFVVHHVHQLVPHAADSSFVSDHAVLVFAIAWVLWMRNEHFKVPIFIWAMIVGISRIYVGVHYPIDVIGSALLSFGTSLLVLYFSPKLEPLMQLLFRSYNFLSSLFPSWHNQEKRDQERKHSV